MSSFDGVLLLSSLLLSFLMLDGMSGLLSVDWSLSPLCDVIGSFGESPSVKECARINKSH